MCCDNIYELLRTNDIYTNHTKLNSSAVVVQNFEIYVIEAKSNSFSFTNERFMI